MRIFCLADTQAEPRLLGQYLQIIDPLLHKADLIVHLGDGVETVRPFLAKYSEVVYLKGNHDKTSDPVQYKFELRGFRFLFVHGAGSFWQEQPNIWLNKIRHQLGKPPRLEAYYSRLYAKYAGQCDLLAYGHIHIPKIETIKQTIFFCPGGLPPERLLFGGAPPSVGQIKIGRLSTSLELSFTIYRLDSDAKQPIVFLQQQYSLRRQTL